MRLTRGLALVCSTATTAVILSAGGAAADDDLISALNNPAVGAVCHPSGQMGLGNTFNGTQNVSCAQSTDQTVTTPTPPADGGVTGTEVAESEVVDVPSGGTAGATAECPAGKVATGGGFTQSGGLIVIHNAPYGSPPTGWSVVVSNPAANPPGFLRAWAVCVDAAE
ncbi:hypothetical protein [Streptomyces sp. NPDC054787]